MSITTDIGTSITGVKPGSLRHLQCAGQFTFSIIDLPYLSFSPPGAVGFIEAKSVAAKSKSGSIL
jgi:hypothetical protein